MWGLETDSAVAQGLGYRHGSQSTAEHQLTRCIGVCCAITPNTATYAITAVSMVGVLVRPWNLSEAVSACVGAALLVVAGLIPWSEAFAAVAKGNDVYLFLVGMMMLSELARAEGLFDYLATLCVREAHGSAKRLFLLVYGVGTLVTIFMSNDATAVVLTPAVLAVSRRAKVAPLPYLLICALIANAASFVLPISNPANLVIFGQSMPPLGTWVWRFSIPSLLAILSTYWVLKTIYREDLKLSVAQDIDILPLSTSGKLAAMGVVLTVLVLLGASALAIPLGLPTVVTAGSICIAVMLYKRESPMHILRHISWSVLTLVAGLFVLVEGLRRTGTLDVLGTWLHAAGTTSSAGAAVLTGTAIAFTSNLINNLPAGLIAGTVAASADADPVIRSAIAIGIDLGPNLSITGSLATILWIVAIRREGEHVSAWQFLKVGAIAMPVALTFALLGLLFQNQSFLR